jgi:hypothetical protein
MKKSFKTFILPIIILALSALIPSTLAKPPWKEPDIGEFTIELGGDIFSDEEGIKAVGYEYRWGAHFRANWAGGHVPDQPVLSFNGMKYDGKDFELTVNRKKREASLYFAWNEGEDRYRLLVSGGYELKGDTYTVTEAEAEIYLMGRGKGELVKTFTVTFSFEYSEGWK